jgi:hypothetical protein
VLASVIMVADDRRMNFPPALWIGFGAVVLAIGGVLLFRRGSSSDGLGAVSDQWVGQHRVMPGDDMSR